MLTESASVEMLCFLVDKDSQEFFNKWNFYLSSSISFFKLWFSSMISLFFYSKQNIACFYLSLLL
jgi:hypothetical protein